MVPHHTIKLFHSVGIDFGFFFSIFLASYWTMTVLSLYVLSKGRKSCNTFPGLLWIMEWKARNGLTIWYELITNIMDSSFITAGPSRLYNCMAKSVHRILDSEHVISANGHTVLHWIWNWNQCSFTYIEWHFVHRRTRKKYIKKSQWNVRKYGT